MTTAPCLATATARTSAAPAASASPELGGDAGAFAAALDLACGPLSAPADGLSDIAAIGLADADGLADKSKPGDEASPGATPDLAALLPGWPPAACAAAPTGVGKDLRGERDDALLRAPDAATAALPERTGSAIQIEPSAPSSATEPLPPASPAQTATNALDSAATSWQSTNAPLPQPAYPASPLSNVPVHATTAPPFEARLTVALDAPAFAPALATQVTWLASEGVQLARLSLNPVEMGPLTVKIVLDGTQARIDFSADMAGTRAVIEASLPSLAAALHGEGLTLAGGGVFDGQARHGEQRERNALRPGDGTPGSASAPGSDTKAPAPHRAVRGLVDLVA